MVGKAHHVHVDLPSNIPLISQCKSAFQASLGDLRGARETQVEFTKGCPLVSQIRSAIESARGDNVSAKTTQMYQLKVFRTMAGKAPVIGHAKACYHWATGNREKAIQNTTNASRSMTVLVLGAIGTAAALPLGPAAPAVGAVMGLAGGLFYDAILCASTGKKTGYIAVCSQIEKGHMSPGDIFNAMLMPLGDAMMGKTGGDITTAINFDIHGAAAVDAGHGGGHDGSAKSGGADAHGHGSHGDGSHHAADAGGHHGGDAGGHNPHAPLQHSQDFVSHGYHDSTIGYGDPPHVVYVDGQAYTVLYAGDGSVLGEMYSFDPSAMHAASANIGYGAGDGGGGLHAGGGGGGASSHAAQADGAQGAHASHGDAGAKANYAATKSAATFGKVLESNMKFGKPHIEVPVSATTYPSRH